MLKKIYLLIFAIFLLNHCGFSPLYTSKSVSNFEIVKIVTQGDRTINNYLKNNLKRFESINSDKKFSINVDTEYNKKVLSKTKLVKLLNMKFLQI